MYQNPLSQKTKKDNFVKTRTQSFQTKYNQSLKRVRNGSSMHCLAGTVYSDKQNQMMSPKKSIVRPSSTSMLSKLNNPQYDHSPVIKGLNTRASHIPNYSDLNTELLLQRRRLEERIVFMKEEIAKQKRLNNKAEMNCKKLQNQIEKGNNAIKDLTIKSDRLIENIVQAKQDCQDNKWALNDRKHDNSEKNATIEQELSYTNALDSRCKLLKNNTLVQQKNRTNLKGELIKAQKVMNSASILMRELEQERANLLLEINKSVSQNKLQ